MEKRNYAVMLLFVFAIVGVYSYPGEHDTQGQFLTDELPHHSHQDQTNDHGVASESHQEYVSADGLRRAKRNNPRQNVNIRKPAGSGPTMESPAAKASRIAMEKEQDRVARDLERRTLVTQFQNNIERLLSQGYKRSAAIELTINDNRQKANRIVELSVYPYA